MEEDAPGPCDPEQTVEEDAPGPCDPEQTVVEDAPGPCDPEQTAEEDAPGPCDPEQTVVEDAPGPCDPEQTVEEDAPGPCDPEQTVEEVAGPCLLEKITPVVLSQSSSVIELKSDALWKYVFQSDTVMVACKGKTNQDDISATAKSALPNQTRRRVKAING